MHRRGLGARLTGTFAALDLTFKALVGAGFVHVMGGRGELVGTIAMVCAPIWLVWLGFVYWSTRPVDRASPDVARERCAQLPTILAIAWGMQWTGGLALVVVVDGHGFDLANGLFLLAMMLGPAPLAHAMTVWLVSSDLRQLEAECAAHGVAPQPRVSTIRSRMMFYALCLVISPSAYMAALGAAARIHDPGDTTFAVAMLVGFTAITVFAILMASLISTAVTRPLVDMAKVIERLGTTKQIGRIPRYQHDEIGVLVQLTNEMLERLERTEGDREAALAKLESKVQAREAELALARRIQTSLLPNQLAIDDLEVAAKMVTADEVGGDYYDVLPQLRGGWIAIGDVSGHGVNAGLIMLMLQCITAAIVQVRPDASARDLVIAINRALFENIRHRLGQRDYATFTLLRYEAGTVKFAGAHEEILVWREKTGACERIETPGPWIGAADHLDHVIVENQLALERGDFLSHPRCSSVHSRPATWFSGTPME